ncbi:hypothetical protein GLOIN_2v1740781 [Rhizophagus clarus]|uniref:Uncharacterized protein n=1 Tax=Rhizophagus clarus TaxID=94130 RepID=A0A8H3LXD4_9GLOM|nr:hypothetical protein GLOIN_2v1740781 [Rhizophagus clarus]
MSADTKNIKTSTCLRPKLLLKPTSNQPIITTSSSMFPPSSSIATGVFILPIKQKNNRKGSRHSPKHLRKPPSFDTYLHSSWMRMKKWCTVRFADVGDDGSSIVSSSSSVDEWDEMDLDEEEEEYIFVSRQSPQTNHYFNFHEKGGST